jgi:gluconolactonase
VPDARFRAALLVALAVGCTGGGEALTPAPPIEPAPPSTLVAAPCPLDPRVLRAPARPFGDPVAVVDLMDADAAESLAVAWRFVDAAIVEVDSNDPGPDLRPTGPAVRSHDVSPRPRAPGWDDAAWRGIEPPSLSARRGHGHFALGWFRTAITLPARIGDTEVEGTTVVFEIVADDYSEVWVDGRLSASPGDSGGGPVSGFNAPNRVVLTRSAEPGHTYDVAVLAMNAPLSVSPPNFLWVRSAVLDVYTPLPPHEPAGRIERRDPALDAILADGARVERIATGFSGLAGMVWTDHALLFCDARANTIHRYDPVEERIGIWRSHSGYAGGDVGRLDEPGARGLAVDERERVIIAERGNRRVVRMERSAAITVLAVRFEDRAFEGPRDVAIDARGALWFTDGSSVLRVDDAGSVTLASREPGPTNGLALSADGDVLFVALAGRVVRRPIARDGSVGASDVALDLGRAAIEALVVDARGNLFVAGASSVTVASAEGRVLGVIALSEPAVGLAWGGDDGRTLFVAGRTSLYRVGLR